MAKVTLLKPFVFSRPSVVGNHMPTEVRFTPARGEHGWRPTDIELPEDIANHPWVAEDYADGAIESPAQAQARLKALTTEREKNDAEAKRINDASEAAMRRASGNANMRAASNAATEEELNTPVNKLGAKRGKDINPQPSEEELNTPANVLQERQANPELDTLEEDVDQPDPVEVAPAPAPIRPTLKRK